MTISRREVFGLAAGATVAGPAVITSAIMAPAAVPSMSAIAFLKYGPLPPTPAAQEMLNLRRSWEIHQWKMRTASSMDDADGI